MCSPRKEFAHLYSPKRIYGHVCSPNFSCVHQKKLTHMKHSLTLMSWLFETKKCEKVLKKKKGEVVEGCRILFFQAINLLEMGAWLGALLLSWSCPGWGDQSGKANGPPGETCASDRLVASHSCGEGVRPGEDVNGARCGANAGVNLRIRLQGGETDFLESRSGCPLPPYKEGGNALARPNA